MMPDISRILYTIPAIIIGFTVHEFFHAFAAYKLGDTTAKEQGRLTLNPIKHIDLIGFLFILFAGFGWAKPVQFSPQNLKNPRRDRGFIALAGPVSNFILGIIFILIVRLMISVTPEHLNSIMRFFSSEKIGDIFMVLFQLCINAAYINFGLAIFNMLPIPPLDGSHVFFSGLNLSYETEMKISRIGMPLLFIIIILQNATDITILPIGRMVDDLVSLFLR
jgi:Zn-dependent protease